MKKIFALFISAVMLFSFAACENNEKDKNLLSSEKDISSSVSEVSPNNSSSEEISSVVSAELSSIEEARIKIKEYVDSVTNDSMSPLKKANKAIKKLHQDFKYRAVALDLSNGYTDELTGDMVLYFFRYRKGSCEHYAAVEKLILEYLGFNAMYVEGDRYSTVELVWGEHLWVIAEMDGAYYHVDGLYGGNHTGGIDKCFFVPDSDMEKSHRWEKTNYPACIEPQPQF